MIIDRRLNKDKIEKILSDIQNLKVGILGDGCVDIYWEADMTKSELSREVPHYPLPIYEERFSLGAGANVVNNLAALGAKDIKYITCASNDWRGMIFFDLLKNIGVSTEYIIQSDKIITPAYCKPIRNGISDVSYEDPRIDFANRTPMEKAIEDKILENLKQAVKDIDILIVSDQFEYGCVTPAVREYICSIGEVITVIVDSRDRIAMYKNVIIKPNEVEATSILGVQQLDKNDKEHIFESVRLIEKQTNKPALLTLGERGAVVCENGKCDHIPAFTVTPPIDFVGAGDSFLAGFSLSLAATKGQSENYPISIEFGCLTSSITIKKIGVTGTASPQEMVESFR